MPIYEYRCNDCDQVFEEWQKSFEETAIPCPICGGSAHRIISHTSFVLKGSGWYVTDYSKSGSSGGNGAGHGAGNGADKTAKSPGCETAAAPAGEAKPAEAASPAAAPDSSATS
jgi:putative FmdB family regulatory protein